MMMFPPLTEKRPLLAVDPGFRAGCKFAILGGNGNVERLESCDWMKNFEKSKRMVGEMLISVQKLASDDASSPVLVALGTGTASAESENLVVQGERAKFVITLTCAWRVLDRP